ncbi:glucose-1-phosphate adenylyltransferase domain protein [Mycobacterium xenopi 4042]|uniref:Glucose-1-phosphate adenylyltransferase domain protein n=1 Tax=Mycobacterium xenopi 4042 TaxID=1299334 RepID=X8DZE7_MYCXE|nr:glucose-1-phosphate adenylyltransferase domain protein [Mycobacterium xenopi 4042]
MNLIYDEDPDYIVVFGPITCTGWTPSRWCGSTSTAARARRWLASGCPLGGDGVRVPRRRRLRSHPQLCGEARRPARHARRSGVHVRVDGQLHLHHQGAHRRDPRRRRGREFRPRHGR